MRTRRLALAMSQEQLAERAGIHPVYVSVLERGRRNATLEVAERIARALDIPLPKLITRALRHGAKQNR